MHRKSHLSVVQDAGTSRRENALASIQKYRPQSVLAQMTWFAFILAMFLLMETLSFLRPSLQTGPYLSALLLVAIASLVRNVVVTQKRLDALVAIVLADDAKR